MNKKLEYYLNYLNKYESPNESDYLQLLNKIDFKVDKDYLDFIQTYNGCEGFFDNDKYVSLWKIEDVIKLNPYYDFIKESEFLFFIGSDGSNVGYAFNKSKESEIVSVDFLEVGIKIPTRIADSFPNFLECLAGD